MKKCIIKRYTSACSIVVSVGEFALMDVPVVKPNLCGVFATCITVRIPLPKDYAAFVNVARCENWKWYISTEFYTETGCSGALPTKRRNGYDSKEEAFIAGIRLFERERKAKRLGDYFAMAKQEFFKCHHRQLSLF